MARKKKPSKKNQTRPRWALRLLIAAFALAALGAIAVVLVVVGFSVGLPNLDTVEDYSPKEVTRVYAAGGEVIASWTDEDRIFRTVLSAEDIPDVMRDAIVAAEDGDFYSHPGLDAVGLVRAMYVNVTSGSLKQGASTITQQVVKNLVLSPERSFRRKIREAILAWRLDKSLEKDDILSIYLNEVFFGVRFYGIEEASRYYFGHSARELNVVEAATLAGLVQSPNRYDPFRHPERALARRHYVLRQMYEKGLIEEGVYRDADAQPLELAEAGDREPWEGQFPFYTDAVRRELEEKVSLDRPVGTAGLRIMTALDVEIQTEVIDALRSELRDFDARHGVHTPFATPEGDEARAEWIATHGNDIESDGLRADREYRGLIVECNEEQTLVQVGPYRLRLNRRPSSRLKPDDVAWSELFPVGAVFSVVPAGNVAPQTLRDSEPGAVIVDLLPMAQAAAVVIDPETREVVALVGGYDFSSSPFNRAVQARRQVGSSFKPYVYAAALDARLITPATIFQDQPITFRQPNGQTWRPGNYDGSYQGEMTVRRALAKSRNVIAVRILDLVGLDRAKAFATAAGIEATLPDNLTLALGSAELTPLEATNGFATLASGGWVEAPTVLRAIYDHAGVAIYERTRDRHQGIDPAVAWLTTNMMTSVVTEGTATRAQRVGHPVAGKTGTTNGPKDAWFIGYTPYYVAGVWVGYDSNQDLGRGETGGGTALPIWTDFMQRVHRTLPVREFPGPPEGIRRTRIDEASGLLAAPGDDGRVEYFLDGTVPTETAAPASERSVQDTILMGGGGAPSEGNSEEAGTTVQDGF